MAALVLRLNLKEQAELSGCILAEHFSSPARALDFMQKTSSAQTDNAMPVLQDPGECLDFLCTVFDVKKGGTGPHGSLVGERPYRSLEETRAFAAELAQLCSASSSGGTGAKSTASETAVFTGADDATTLREGGKAGANLARGAESDLSSRAESESAGDGDLSLEPGAWTQWG